MRWALPAALALISTGLVVFAGQVSVSFVLDRFEHVPFWIVLSLIAIAIEVLGAVAITELARRKRFVAALLGVPFLALAVAATVSFEIDKFAQASSNAIASRQFETDAFESNRQELADLRRKRDTALKKGWTYDDWFAFEESAAILEFCEGLDRNEAEKLALDQCGL